MRYGGWPVSVGVRPCEGVRQRAQALTQKRVDLIDSSQDRHLRRLRSLQDSRRGIPECVITLKNFSSGEEGSYPCFLPSAFGIRCPTRRTIRLLGPAGSFPYEGHFTPGVVSEVFLCYLSTALEIFASNKARPMQLLLTSFPFLKALVIGAYRPPTNPFRRVAGSCICTSLKTLAPGWIAAYHRRFHSRIGTTCFNLIARTRPQPRRR